MKLFQCQSCGLLLFFENRYCGSCNHRLGYHPEAGCMAALEEDGQGAWRSMALPDTKWKFCANMQHDACNWLLPTNDTNGYCIACRHNHTVPDLALNNNLVNWRKMELAKHRLFYALVKLGLPLPTRTEQPEKGLMFEFLAEPLQGGGKVMTGHDEGIITIALSEADDAEREKRRTSMHEPYRTLLGHFRHEIGHYYWDRLIKDENRQDACRALFGDDREDYDEALKRHYNQGPPANWQQNHVSTYATSHAWEDFAETWAHYMHIIDCLETARTYGLEIHPTVTSNEKLDAKVVTDPYRGGDFKAMIDQWLLITFAMNAMNRSMGLNDIYPFVLTPPVIEKMTFIHDVVHAQRMAPQMAMSA